jgi:hypothetical protein
VQCPTHAETCLCNHGVLFLPCGNALRNMHHPTNVETHCGVEEHTHVETCCAAIGVNSVYAGTHCRPPTICRYVLRKTCWGMCGNTLQNILPMWKHVAQWPEADRIIPRLRSIQAPECTNRRKYDARRPMILFVASGAECVQRCTDTACTVDTRTAERMRTASSLRSAPSKPRNIQNG